MTAIHPHRRALLQIFSAALRAVAGDDCVAAALQRRSLPDGVRLVAVGKAAQSMADGAKAALGGRLAAALLISKVGHLDRRHCRRFGWQALESGHPLPDAASLQAGQQLIRFIEADVGPLLLLISGGASSLLELPVPGVGLEQLLRTNQWLQASGLPIDQINRVRKSLSLIKGGGLLNWLGEREVTALAISDVPGDDPGVIGSGLLLPDLTLDQRGWRQQLPGWLDMLVANGLSQRRRPLRDPPPVEIVANLQMAKQAAAQQARTLDYAVRVEPEFIVGDAAEAGRRLAARLRVGPAGVWIWGGESTVVLPPSPGRGGRNQQLALAAACELAGEQNCLFLSAGSDGSDGPTDDAGALVDGATIARAEREGFDAAATLRVCNAGELLQASGDLLSTGPTGTNVMDLMLGLKLAPDNDQI
ncbi:Glycerate-2-kinase [endosymbiont of Ridgeia piscesae]|jgi:hydroxypyruvate reductase|uniref:Glycerate-2-kinase n=3 Tax=endosymbiont of Ridgeia piscesae TaxID=54398 RepID=A0A0T5YWC2_9GAMM|nr:Glycerate-2-kinase [endosymbiont of Ridgeia piscesae]